MRIKTAIFLLGSLIIIIPLKPKLFKSKWLVLPKSNMVPGNKYIQLPQYFSGGQCDAMLKSMVSGVQLDSNGSLHNFRQVTNYHPPPVPRFPDLKGKKKGTLTPLPWACINIKQLFQSTIQHSSLVYSNSPRNVRAFRMTMMTCQPLSWFFLQCWWCEYKDLHCCDSHSPESSSKKTIFRLDICFSLPSSLSSFPKPSR